MSSHGINVLINTPCIMEGIQLINLVSTDMARARARARPRAKGLG